MKEESGQVVIILLLVMVLALAIGLSVIGRSINEISTSTKTEDSTRAFSAAEAGIERLLYSGSGGTNSITFSNQSQTKNLEYNSDLPRAQTALEYPPFGKESFAQFWLANPENLSAAYTQGSFDLYFGDGTADYTSKPDNQPAIEVKVIIYSPSGSGYYSKAYFYDSKNDRAGGNSFDTCKAKNQTIDTNTSAGRLFYCAVSVPPGVGAVYKENANDIPVMVRARMLYSNISHPLALKPTGSGSLPFQAVIYKSTGVAGDTQRTLSIFQQKLVMPQIFDYALFSAGDLSK